MYQINEVVSFKDNGDGTLCLGIIVELREDVQQVEVLTSHCTGCIVSYESILVSLGILAEKPEQAAP